MVTLLWIIRSIFQVDCSIFLMMLCFFLLPWLVDCLGYCLIFIGSSVISFIIMVVVILIMLGYFLVPQLVECLVNCLVFLGSLVIFFVKSFIIMGLVIIMTLCSFLVSWLVDLLSIFFIWIDSLVISFIVMDSGFGCFSVLGYLFSSFVCRFLGSMFGIYWFLDDFLGDIFHHYGLGYYHDLVLFLSNLVGRSFQ